jgi:tyrosine-protein phosphatase YwqE
MIRVRNVLKISNRESISRCNYIILLFQVNKIETETKSVLSKIGRVNIIHIITYIYIYIYIYIYKGI